VAGREMQMHVLPTAASSSLREAEQRVEGPEFQYPVFLVASRNQVINQPRASKLADVVALQITNIGLVAMRPRADKLATILDSLVDNGPG
jgi:hypothetical protein